MPDDIARAEERCMERLKSKIQVLETSYDFDTARLEEKCERLQKQLDIAVKALEDVATFMTCDEVEIREIQPEFCADQAALDRVNEAMKKIKELNNV